MIKIYKDFNEVLTLNSSFLKDGRNLLPEDTSIIKNGSILFDEEKIIWTGETSQIPSKYLKEENEISSFKDHVVTPEIVDSHTHLLFAGDRSEEYQMRLNGVSYQEISKQGGGILSSILSTNMSSDEELFNSSVKKINEIYQLGIGTIEIKSGYALSYTGEKRCSLIISKLKNHFKDKVTIFNTFMAAHAVPKEFSSSQEYLNQVVLPLMEELAHLSIIDAVDIFHEKNYFSLNDVKSLFSKANDLHLKTKIHADEFYSNKGASTACDFNSLSADHLLKISNAGIKSLSTSSTVATLLPATGWFLGKKQAPGKKLLNAGCKVALASDYNPGSAHFNNLIQIASMAAPMYPLNSAQLWSSITLNAAHALGIRDQGAIREGLRPKFSIFKTNSIAKITYNWGKNFSINSNK